jgi:hypothetical protein
LRWILGDFKNAGRLAGQTLKLPESLFSLVQIREDELILFLILPNYGQLGSQNMLVLLFAKALLEIFKV